MLARGSMEEEAEVQRGLGLTEPGGEAQSRRMWGLTKQRTSHRPPLDRRTPGQQRKELRGRPYSQADGSPQNAGGSHAEAPPLSHRSQSPLPAFPRTQVPSEEEQGAKADI